MIRSKIALWAVVSHLWFNRKWIFKTLPFARCHSAPASKISRQLVDARLSYWRLGNAFISVLGVPPKRPRVLKRRGPICTKFRRDGQKSHFLISSPPCKNYRRSGGVYFEVLSHTTEPLVNIWWVALHGLRRYSYTGWVPLCGRHKSILCSWAPWCGPTKWHSSIFLFNKLMQQSI